MNAFNVLVSAACATIIGVALTVASTYWFPPEPTVDIRLQAYQECAASAPEEIRAEIAVQCAQYIFGGYINVR